MQTIAPVNPIGSPFSADHVQILPAAVDVPGLGSCHTTRCFHDEQTFSCNPELRGVLGDVVPMSHPGRLAVCQMAFGKFSQDLIFATLMKIDRGAWKINAADQDSATAVASRIIAAAEVYFRANQVEELICFRGSNGLDQFLADDDLCNYFPVMAADGEICFLEIHKPHCFGRPDNDKYKWRVEAITYEEMLSYSCDQGDRLFLRNLPPSLGH